MGASRVVGARLCGAACVLSVLAATPPSTAPTEQDRLDAAMAGVDDRMHAAGWPSPPNHPAGPPRNRTPEGSPVRDECGYDALGIVSWQPWFFPGETARAFAEGFERQVPLGAGMSFELVEIVAITVDDSGLAAIDAFVDAIGSPEHASCRHDRDTEFYGHDATDIVTVDDLGLGDGSSQQTWTNTDYSVGDYYLGDSNTTARIDHTLVIVWYSVTGQASSGFDPVAELSAIVTALT